MTSTTPHGRAGQPDCGPSAAGSTKAGGSAVEWAEGPEVPVVDVRGVLAACASAAAVSTPPADDEPTDPRERPGRQSLHRAA